MRNKVNHFNDEWFDMHFAFATDFDFPQNRLFIQGNVTHDSLIKYRFNGIDDEFISYLQFMPIGYSDNRFLFY